MLPPHGPPSLEVQGPLPELEVLPPGPPELAPLLDVEPELPWPPDVDPEPEPVSPELDPDPPPIVPVTPASDRLSLIGSGELAPHAMRMGDSTRQTRRNRSRRMVRVRMGA
jgi:hypothetical protein